MPSIGTAIGGIAIAAGLAFAGLQVAESVAELRKSDRVVTVKGLAEREVEATIASWRIPYRGVAEDAQTALAAAQRSSRQVRAFLEEGGLPDDEITFEPYTLRIERVYLQQGGTQVETQRYTAVGAARVRTENVDAVDALSGGTLDLLDAGVLLGDSDYAEASKPQYLFTELNAIKPDLLTEATSAARRSAEQFASDSGATVGAIASANQGVIQILPRDGQYDERAERNKIVRVVSTVEYYLDD